MNYEIFDTAPRHRQATMTRRSFWLPVLLALFAVCAQAQAQNATGIPAVTYASGIIAPTEDSAITANGGSGSTAIADTDGLGTFSWQWSAADTNGGDYADIAMATNAAFTPGDDEVGKFLRVCASFRDNAGNNEERCLPIATAVANINDKPVPVANTISVSTTADADNPYVFSADDFPFTDVDGDMLAGIEIAALPGRDSTAGPGSPGTLALNGTALTAVPASTITVAQLEAGALTYYPPEGEQPTNPNDPFARLAFFGFDVVDDGSDGNTNNVSNVGRTIDIRLVSVNQTAASGRPRIVVLNVPTDIHTHAEGTQLRADTRDIVEPNGIDRSTLEWQWQLSSVGDGVFADISGATGGTFTPGHAHVGMHIRVCASFMDNHAMPETVEDLCSASIRVTNANDAPVAQDHAINVSVDATMANPYAFSTDDFPFDDEDDDNLASVILESLPQSGALRNGSAAAAVGDIIAADAIDDLTYYPAAEQNVQTGYARFDFKVTDDGSDGSDNRTSANTAAITINLVPANLRLRLRLFLEGPLR